MATGGFKLSLSSARGKPGLKASLEQPAKRRRLLLDDDEPEDPNAAQEITGWDAAEGGAVDANAKKEKPKGPRVIPAQPNRDRREEARQRHLALRAESAAENGNGENREQMERPKVAFGLTTFDKTGDAQNGEDKPEPMDIDGENKPEDTRTEEEKLQAEAIDVLVNGKTATQAVIPISDKEAFENDMRDAPEAPTLASYEATPIEGFGAALLRGMGWKDGEALGKDKKPVAPAKDIKRRPALLGIGAKPEAAVGIEMGEWGGGKKGYKKPAATYNPLTLRNKKTGELITEEELKKRMEKQKENNTFVGDDKEDERRREKHRERKDRDRRDDEDDSERRRDKGRRDDGRKYRDDDYDDRDHGREKKYLEYKDADRDRQREKKYREDDYDDRKRSSHRDKDRGRRDRSRSPCYDDDRRSKRRERDRRERSADSDKYRREKRREREYRDGDGARSKDSDDRRRKRRDYGYDDEKEDRRSKHRDDKYSRG